MPTCASPSPSVSNISAAISPTNGPGIWFAYCFYFKDDLGHFFSTSCDSRCGSTRPAKAARLLPEGQLVSPKAACSPTFSDERAIETTPAPPFHCPPPAAAPEQLPLHKPDDNHYTVRCARVDLSRKLRAAMDKVMGEDAG